MGRLLLVNLWCMQIRRLRQILNLCAIFFLNRGRKGQKAGGKKKRTCFWSWVVFYPRWYLTTACVQMRRWEGRCSNERLCAAVVADAAYRRAVVGRRWRWRTLASAGGARAATTSLTLTYAENWTRWIWVTRLCAFWSAEMRCGGLRDRAGMLSACWGLWRGRQTLMLAREAEGKKRQNQIPHFRWHR